MERAIEFLLQSQARAEERQDRTDQQITEMSEQLRIYAETQSQFIDIATRTMQGLAASQERTDRKIAETNARIAETNTRLAETNARTEQRIVETNERTEQLITAMHARITETDMRVTERMVGSRALADETNARLAQLAAIQAETDQRLNRLTALMERIIADGNGDLEQ